MTPIVFHPIGIVHSPFDDSEGMPIQPAGADGVAGVVTLFPDYLEGLQGS